MYRGFTAWSWNACIIASVCLACCVPHPGSIPIPIIINYFFIIIIIIITHGEKVPQAESDLH